MLSQPKKDIAQMVKVNTVCEKTDNNTINTKVFLNRIHKVPTKLLLFLFLLAPNVKSEPFSPHHFNSNSFEGDHPLVFEIENVQQEIMEPCRDQYINNEGIPPKERKNEMIDCLIFYSDNKFKELASHSNLSFPQRIQGGRNKTLPLRFGLQPHEREDVGYPRSLQILIHADDDGYSGQIEFDAVIPLEESSQIEESSTQTEEYTQTSALFGQLGFILSVRDKKNEEVLGSENNSFSTSTGLVYTFVVQDGILGFNLFYDRSWALHARSLQHERLSTGVDYQNDNNLFSFNYYHPLSDWVDISDYYEERSLKGVDFSWKQRFTERWEGSVSISTKDRITLSAGIDYKIDCGESLGFALEQGLSSQKTKISSQYEIAWGGGYKGENCKPYENGRKGLFYQPVQRDKNIHLERDRRSPQLNIPDQYIN